MIIETTKDGRPLFFTVKHKDGRDISSYNLSDALYQAVTFGADTIKVSVFDDEKEEVIDDINVDKLLRLYYSNGANAPIQYAYIESGGLEVEE